MKPKNKVILIAFFILGFISNIIAQQVSPEWDFKGKYLIAISDADMLASAYENGKLGPRHGKDQLSVIPLNTNPSQYKAYSIEASNSVAGPPSVVDVTPNSKYAYVIETFGSRPDKSDAETFAQLQLGNQLSIFDLSNPKKPLKIDQITIGNQPLSVNVNKDGTYLAISYAPSKADDYTPLSLHKIKTDGTLDGYFKPKIPNWENHYFLIDVAWHPKKNILSLLNQTTNAVQFVELQDDVEANTLLLNQWGNSVVIGKFPAIGRFSKDGKHFLANNLFWGPDVSNTYTEGPNGTIVNISLNHFQRNGNPVHSLTSQVMVGASPEGFALSNNGRYVVAVNMERSWLLYDDKRQSWHSSLTLIERDTETGAMNVMNTIPYYAILPEMAVFDASSKYLAVVAFDQYDPNEAGGALDFFKIVKDPLDKDKETLVQTKYGITLQHGSHDLILVE